MDRKNTGIRLLLLPATWLYSLVTGFRNLLFDWKILPSKKFPIPIICIGNISTGGTGKTPLTEYLITLLTKHYRVAALSRGYKRKTSGFLLVTEVSSVDEAGDEACQVKQKFPKTLVAVDGNRRRGISRLLSLPDAERPDVILLDDAMQHRYVIPTLTLMLTDYHNMYYDDRILPAGNLRESVHGVYRADLILVTKCDEALKPIDLRIIEKNMSLMTNQRLYFSDIKYHPIKALFPSHAPDPSSSPNEPDLLLVAGIAAPQSFVKTLQSRSKNVHTCIFPDHHPFGPEDIRRIDAEFQKMPSPRRIICTEKDAMRLKALPCLPEAWKPHLFYLPVSVEFLFGQGEDFDTRILKHVSSNLNISKKNVKN
jgi:tetraacyldisaccharide 4'-kinase